VERKIMSNILNEEIKKNLYGIVQENIDDYEYFHFGEFVEKPNQCGCFERNGNWYTYVIDEKNFCTFGGPYSRNGIICACTMILPITMVKEQYNFTEEEFNIYLHNHFHSLEEIDKNVNRNNKALQFYEHMGMRKLREGDFPIGNGYYMNDYIMGLEI
jgi:hypothetical protein